jgi:hypothetical protein
MINEYEEVGGMRIPAILKKAVKVMYRKEVDYMVGVYDMLDHFDFIVVI